MIRMEWQYVVGAGWGVFLVLYGWHHDIFLLVIGAALGGFCAGRLLRDVT